MHEVGKAVLEGRIEELEGEAPKRHRRRSGGRRSRIRCSAGEEHARAMRHVERRLVRLESGRSESGTPPSTGADSEPGPKRRYAPSRPYPQLVTLEAEPNEDLVYGDATPVIVEWRSMRAEFLKTRTTLDRTDLQERMLELELAIVEEHGLTLPPASFPWDKFDRRDQVWERRQDLKRVRAERNRALLRRWLRRVLTVEMVLGSGHHANGNGHATVEVNGNGHSDEAPEPQQTLFSWAEFMVEEPVKPKSRKRPSREWGTT